MKLPKWRRSTARTTLLSVAALGALLWAAASQLGLSVNSLVAQFLVLLMAFALVVVFAGLVGVLLGLLRRRR